MSQSLRIGRVFGVDIGLHPSWFVIALLVTYSLATGPLPANYPGWPDAWYWMVGGVVALLFFGSVLAHELSHALVARRLGLKVKDITLFIFGGAASLEEDARRPRDEALIGAAGPITSLLIGGGLWLVVTLVELPQVEAILTWLALINVSLGVFNLIPGFPMDGGRILRALLWRLRGDRFEATRNAAAVGRLFGYLLIGGGVLMALQGGNVFNGVWLALIGWFLSNAAESSVAQMTLEHALRGAKVRDVLEPEPPSVSPNETVADLVNERLAKGQRCYLVRHADGGLAGIVTLSDVGRVKREDWDAARVTDIMTRFADLATIGPDADLQSALKTLQAREVNQLPVVDPDGRAVLGLLTRAGVLRLVDARLKLGV